MKVSVIVPTYNSEKFICQSLDSVVEQFYCDWEIIIVDDCSTDRSYEIAQQYSSKDNRIKAIRLNQNSGAAIARNTGIKLAQGRYIAFLDSDDIWLPNKLEIQIKFMQRNNIDFCFSGYQKINEAGAVVGQIGVPEKIAYKNLLKTCSIGCLTAVYDTKKLGKIYMPQNTKREDFSTWLNILKKIEYGYGINEILAQYRVYPLQTSSKKINMAKENWYLYKHIENLGLLKSFYYFSHYVIRGILRKNFPKIARFIGVLK